MRKTPTITDRISDAIIQRLIRRALTLPWERRLAYVGDRMSRIAAPLMGYRTRIRRNLAFVCPDLSAAEVEAIVREVPDNMGRTLVEMYSGDEFIERCRAVPVAGPGLAALEAAREAGRGAVLITGHFGNYDVPRAALIGRGIDIAALYRPMNNPLFNAHYVEAMQRIGPTYERNKSGMKQLILHLRRGGVVEFLIDQHMSRQPELSFFGKPALTSTAAAEMSLRHEVPLICMYGIRRADGIGFDIAVEAPVPPTDAMTMTQAMNDSLEARVRRHMGQWIWSHRRWRVPGNRP